MLAKPEVNAQKETGAGQGRVQTIAVDQHMSAEERHVRDKNLQMINMLCYRIPMSVCHDSISRDERW